MRVAYSLTIRRKPVGGHVENRFGTKYQLNVEHDRVRERLRSNRSDVSLWQYENDFPDNRLIIRSNVTPYIADLY